MPTLEHFAKFKMAAKMAAKSIFSQILASFRNPLTVVGDLRIDAYICDYARLEKHTYETPRSQGQGQTLGQHCFRPRKTL